MTGWLVLCLVVNGQIGNPQAGLPQEAITAQKKGDVDRLRELIAATPEIALMRDLADDYHPSLLLRAAYDSQPSIVRLLLEHGADVNAAYAKSANGPTSLHLATDPETVRVLLEFKPLFTMRDWSGNTPLQAASERLASLREADSVSGLAFDGYETRDAQEIVNLLLDAGADYDIESAVYLDDLRRVASIAETQVNPLTAQLLTERSDALRVAASHGRADICQLLLKKGVNPDGYEYDREKDARPGTWGNLPIIAEAVSYPRVVALLIESGAIWQKPIAWRGGSTGLGIFDSTNASLLHYAAAKGDVSTVELLLAKGMNVDVRDGSGATPLHVAASRGHIPIVRRLLQSGANLSAQDSVGDSPLACAQQLHSSNRVLLDLLRSGVDIVPDSREHEPK
jgi:ankyrin repeat protein